MLQRKQTLYLLLSAVLMALLPFVRLASLMAPSETFDFAAMGLSDAVGELIVPTWSLFALNVVVVLLSFLTIFLFKNRVLQMRFTIFGLLLKVGFIILAYVLFSSMSKVGESVVVYSVWAALPFIAIILDYLAYRGIAIDERTVKYIDRLR